LTKEGSLFNRCQYVILGIQRWKVLALSFLFAGLGHPATPELFLQIPHSSKINAIIRSPDDRFLATAGYDHTVRLWSTDTGLLERALEGHQAEVAGIAFDPQSKLIASGSADATVRVWDVRTGALVRKLDAGAKVGSVAWNMTASKLAAMTDAAVEIWDTVTWTPIAKSSDNQMWTAQRSDRLLFSNDDRTLLADGSSGYGTKLIDVATGFVRGAIGPTAPGTPGSHPGALVVSYEAARSWKLIDPTDLSLLRVFTPLDLYASSFALSPDQHLIANTADTHVSVMDAQSGAERFRFNYPDSPAPGIQPVCIVFSADSKKLFVGDNMGTIRTYELQQGTLLRQTKTAPHVHTVGYGDDGTLAIVSGRELVLMPKSGHFQSALLHTETMSDMPVSAAAVIPDQTLVATTYGIGNGMLWSARTGLLQGGAPVGHRFEVEDVIFSPSGKLFATAGCDTRVLIFSVQDRKLHRELKDTDCAAQVRITADDREAVVGYGGGFAFKQVSLSDSATKRNTAVEVWDIASGNKLRVLQGLSEAICSLDLSANGEWIAAADRAGIAAVWSARDGSRLGLWSMDARVVRFSPDGQTLAVAGNASVQFLYLGSRKITSTKLPLTFPGQSLAFSSDGKRLAVGEGPQVSLWHYPGGEPICTTILDGENGYFIALPDGNYMSRGATDFVSFRLNDQVYYYDQFDMRYNRPDQVLSAYGATDKSLTESYLWAYRKRLERSNLNEQAISDGSAAPQLSVDLRQPADDRAEVRVNARSETELANVLIEVNGTPVAMAPDDRVPPGANTFTQAYSLTLSPGTNSVRVVARTINGAESLSFDRELFNRRHEGRRDLYLLAIGISEYSGTGRNLTYADKDAEAVSDYFKKQHGEYAHVYSTVLRNSGATKKKIMTAALSLRAARQDDTVIVFLSGHGLLDGNRNYYFGASGIDFSKPGENGLSYADLEHILSEGAARNKLLLIDSCHSGEVDSVPEFNPVAASSAPTGKAVVRARLVKKDVEVTLTDYWSATQIIEESFSDLRRGSGASVIASSSGTEYSVESEDFKGGLFTYALVAGLSGGRADANKDGHISVQELKTYVTAQVLDLSNGAQHVSMRADNRFDNFDVGMPNLLLSSWRESEQPVEAVALSPDGSIAVAGDRTGTFKVWDVATGNVLPPIYIGSFFPGAFSVSSDRLFLWTGNGVAEYDPSKQKVIRWQPTRAGVYLGFFGQTGFQPKIHRFISNNLGHISLIDTETSKVVSSWNGPKEPGSGRYAFSADGSLVASPNAKDRVEVRDALSGTLRLTVAATKPSTFAFSSDGALLAVGTGDNRAIVFDTRTGGLVASLGSREEKNLLSAVSFCAGTTLIAGGSSDGSVRLWDVTGKSPSPVTTFANNDPVTSMGFDGTGRRLIVGGKSGFVRIFEVQH
jgi:WD40 repeat protein